MPSLAQPTAYPTGSGNSSFASLAGAQKILVGGEDIDDIELRLTSACGVLKATGDAIWNKTCKTKVSNITLWIDIELYITPVYTQRQLGTARSPFSKYPYGEASFINLSLLYGINDKPLPTPHDLPLNKFKTSGLINKGYRIPLKLGDQRGKEESQLITLKFGLK